MSKQTAIQLLRETIDSEMKLGTKMVINWDVYLAMEREQIENAWHAGVSDSDDCKSWYNERYRATSEKYYNNTYKGGEQ